MNDEAAAAPEESQEHDDEQTLGSRLRTARHSRELSIEKIADELRIEEHVLVALEEDRLSDIKVAPVFVKGYIKQYGRLLQLDYDELRQAFHNQVDAVDVSLKPNSSIMLRDERQITIWIVAAIAVVLVGIALFVWWVGADDVQLFGDRGSASPNADTAVTLPAPVLPSRSETQSSVSQAAPDQSSQQRSPEPAAPAAQDETAAVGRPGATQQTAEAAISAGASAASGAGPDGDAADATAPPNAATASASSTGAGAAPAAVANVAPPPPGSVPMRFEFAEQSWFELEDAAGRRLYYDLADADSTLNFSALPPARVLIGNAAAVTITVDAAEYAIPPGTLRGNVASFLIEPARD